MQKTDGSAIAPKPGHDSTGKFIAGHNEYRARKDRIAALVDQLAADFDSHSATARQLMAIAAQHLDQAAMTRNSALRGRATRLATRLLDRLEKKPTKKLNAFDQYVLDKYGATR
jgi:hypothetical protein